MKVEGRWSLCPEALDFRAIGRKNLLQEAQAPLENELSFSLFSTFLSAFWMPFFLRQVLLFFQLFS